MITTGTMGPLTDKDLARMAFQGYKEHTALFPRLFSVATSTYRYEKVRQMGGFSNFENLGEGASVTFGDPALGPEQTFIQEPYGFGFMYTDIMDEDDLHGDVAKRYTKMLVRAGAHTREVLHMDVLNDGYAGASYVCADGLSLFNAAHTYKSGTFRNVLPVATDLDQAALEDAYALFALMKSHEGVQATEIEPSTLLVSKRGNNRFNAFSLLESESVYSNANDEKNPFGPKGMADLEHLKIVASPHLTDEDAWSLHALPGPRGVEFGLMSFNRRPLTLTTDGDIRTGNAIVKATFRNSRGIVDPRCAVGSPGA